MLTVNNIEVVYSSVVLVLRGVSLEVPDGKIVSILGANGAGKTTTLKAISGLLRRNEGEITRGSVEFDGERLDRMQPEDIVRRGIVLVIGRGLMARPKLMLLDEPSLGLAPLLVEEIFRVVRQINVEAGMSILLVEQNARIALEAAHYNYVMETGRVVLDGPSAQLKQNEDVKEFYLGLTQLGEHKSYREVKHYKRRKRWLG